MQHLVIVKYTDLVRDRAAFETEVEALFQGLTAIDGIHDIRLIPGKPTRGNRFDLIIRISMDENALGAYDESEIHKTWKRDYAKYVLNKAIFDCEDGLL